jgi:flagellar biosynthesis/type III secretory pathway chaperone
MDAELEKYRSLLNLARRKADLLTSRAPVAEIEGVVEAEASLVAEIVRVEQTRLAVMHELTAGLGLAPKATLADVATAAGGTESKSLTSVGTSTVRVLKELRDVNRLNEALLSQELALIDFSLDLYTNRGADHPGTYSFAGEAQRSPGASSVILDAKA